MLPIVAVDGVGAVELPTPPVAVVYQRRLLPVAVKGTAVAFWQYVTGDVTVGAGGVVTVSVVVAVQVVEFTVTVSV